MTDSVAVFSVGQQLAVTALTLTLGFAALLLIFRYRSFQQVLRESREHRKAEKAEEARKAVA
jgi:hypothetical protein